MTKKTETAIDRLQRAARSDRPSESERERVADQLLTQDQLRRVDKSLTKIVPTDRPRRRKKPPLAQPLLQDAKPDRVADLRPDSSRRPRPRALQKAA